MRRLGGVGCNESIQGKGRGGNILIRVGNVRGVYCTEIITAMWIGGCIVEKARKKGGY